MTHDWQFGVNTYPIQIKREDGQIIEPPQYKAICHETKPIVFYVGSDRYLPIPHGDLMNPVLGKIDQDKYDINIVTTKSGARMYATIQCKTTTLLDKIGSMKFGIKVVNSLDGSRRLEIHMALMRVICSNGMVATKILGGFKRRHLQSSELTISSFSNTVIEQLHNVSVMDNLKKLLAPMNEASFNEILRKMELPKKYADVAQNVYNMPEITSITPEERDTLWGGFNILTYVLTHETERMSLDRKHDFSVALDNLIAKAIS